MLLYLLQKLYQLAEEIGGYAHFPMVEDGTLEGVPHVWTVGVNPRIIIFTDLIDESAQCKDKTEITFDTNSHEYLTAKEFLKLYPDCTSIEFRPLSSLVEVKE